MNDRGRRGYSTSVDEPVVFVVTEYNPKTDQVSILDTGMNEYRAEQIRAASIQLNHLLGNGIVTRLRKAV